MLAALFLAATTASLALGPQIHPMARAAGAVQIVLSAATATMGVTLVWLVITFLAGRVYCSTACPIGTFSDLFLWLRRRIPALNKPFSYRPHSKWSPHILWVYLLSIIVGIWAVAYAMEPWNMARNMAAGAGVHGAVENTWGHLALGMGTGAVLGILSAVAIAATSLWRGREFCTRWCPVGTMLGLVQEHSIMHIEFDPDRCDSCGICEDRCRAQAIKVVGRHIDEARCVRCFDCVADCPRQALNYQINRNRPATPLMRKKKRSL